jgi:hypothetical protein
MAFVHPRTFRAFNAVATVCISLGRCPRLSHFAPLALRAVGQIVNPGHHPNNLVFLLRCCKLHWPRALQCRRQANDRWAIVRVL